MHNTDLADPQAKRHIQEIDGLRGIAILLVVIFHWIVQPLNPIFVKWGIEPYLDLFRYGVDLFFVISGFLIGGILQRISKRPSGIATFYYRRILRIWPLYYLLLGTVLLTGRGQQVLHGIPPWSFVFFIFNFWESAGKPLAFTSLGILWSLAIEEQFYALGPMMFYFFNEKQIARPAVFWVCISPLLRLILLWNTNIDQWRFTPIRLDGICIGIFLSILVRSPANRQIMIANINKLKLATLLSISVSLICKGLLTSFYWIIFGPTLISISFGLLLATVYSEYMSGRKMTVLNSSTLGFFGLRCYSIYLFHLFFMYLANNLSESYYIALIIQTGLTILFAHLSWKYFEYPLILLGKKFTY